jgi:WD40 repeat protein/serine/threonine protein kinase
MASSSSERNPVERLAEEFAARLRRGERPALSEYTAQYPQYAEQIQELFPALAMMEQLKPAEGDLTGPENAPRPEDVPPLECLGDYRIVREVGRGGMGIVYEAEQQALGRRVALKVLPRKLLADSQHRRRFEREARLAAKLHHTNIVPVFGVGEQDGLPYYVMQFIQGLGLNEVLEELTRLRAGGEPQRAAAYPQLPAGKELSAADVARSLLTGPFELGVLDASLDQSPADHAGEEPLAAPSTGRLGKHRSDSSVVLPGQSGPSGQRKAKSPTYWQSVAQIGVQVAGALEYAHQQGVLHRDIKPSNLLLDRRTTVWVTDFGLAKAADSEDLTNTGDVLGTLRYMPPEAFEGRTDACSDLYSLGLTLYELLAFRPAFDEKDRNKLIKQVTTGEPPRLNQLNSEVPRDLVTIVHKVIDRDPHQRYASAGELAADLQRFTDDEPIKARPIGTAERLWRWCRHNPLLAGALTAVAATLILGTVVAWFLAAWALNEKGRADSQRQAAQLAEANAKNEAERAENAKAQANLEARRAQRQAYMASIPQMQQAWESHHMLQLQDLLAKTADSRDRGFEWYYLQRLSHVEHLTLLGHTGGLRAVAFAPDGQRLVTGSIDSTARVWDANTGQELLCLRGHGNDVRAVAYAPDGRWLVTGSIDGTARIWDAARGHKLRTLQSPHTSPIWAVAVTPDSQRVLAGCQDGTARVWDAMSGRELLTLTGLPALGAGTVGLLITPPALGPVLAASALYPGRTGHTHAVRGVAVTPDGKRLVTAGEDNLLMIWDAANGRQLRSWIGGFSIDQGIHGIAVTPDGRRLLTAGRDNSARVWDADTGRELLSLERPTGWVMSVAASPDGQRLVVGHHTGVVNVWEMVDLPDIGASTVGLLGSLGAPGPILAASTLYWERTPRMGGRENMTLKGPDDPVMSVAVSLDGRRLATATMDGMARLWDMASGRATRTLTGHTDVVYSVAVTPDGKRIVTGSFDGTARVWDVTSGQELLPLRKQPGKAVQVVVTPDGKRIIAGDVDGKVWVWDAVSGRELRTLQAHESPVYTIAVTPDGQRVVTGSRFGSCKISDITSDRGPLELKGHNTIVASAAVAPDGHWLVTGSLNGTRVWDLTTGRELRPFLDTGSTRALAIIPNSRRVVAGLGSGTATVRDTVSGQELMSLRGHTDLITSVAVTSDGQRIVTGSVDRTVRVWDAGTGRQLLILSGHTGPVWSVAVTPDGQRIITGSEDGTVKIWEAATPDQVNRWTRQEQEAARRLAIWKRPEPGARGFIQDWLVLAPLKLKTGEIGADGIEPEQVRDEAQLRPRAGDHASWGGQEIRWKAHHPKDPVLDFNGFVGEQSDYTVAYAACYVISPAERNDLWFQVGSDDEAKVYLNGKLIYKYPVNGFVDTLHPAGPVKLLKGTNVLVLKVVNEQFQWACCARFVDGEGNPVQGLEVRLTPE